MTTSTLPTDFLSALSPAQVDTLRRLQRDRFPHRADLTRDVFAVADGHAHVAVDVAGTRVVVIVNAAGRIIRES